MAAPDGRPPAPSRPTPKKTRVKPVHRQVRDETERLQIWVRWRISGAKATARVHAINRETVRLIARAINDDPDRLARAEAMLASLNAEHHAELAQTVASARVQLAAALAAGEVQPRELIRAIEVLAPMAGLRPLEDKPTGGGLAIPTYLAEPRVDATEKVTP